MTKHTFAAFQHVNGKIIPAYRDPVEIDMLDVRDAEPHDISFHGSLVCTTIATMSNLEQHILDVPYNQFMSILTMERLFSQDEQS